MPIRTYSIKPRHYTWPNLNDEWGNSLVEHGVTPELGEKKIYKRETTFNHHLRKTRKVKLMWRIKFKDGKVNMENDRRQFYLPRISACMCRIWAEFFSQMSSSNKLGGFKTPLANWMRFEVLFLFLVKRIEKEKSQLKWENIRASFFHRRLADRTLSFTE